MVPIRQDLETTRRQLDDKLQLIARYLMLAGLLPTEIRKEMHAAVGRAVFGRYHKKPVHSVPRKAAARDAG